MVRCYLSGDLVHDRTILAFYDGCTTEKRLVLDWAYEPAEIAVVFGVYKSKVPISIPRGRIIAEQQRRNLDTIVLETGYINRGDGETHHYAVGFNGLNGRADFRNSNCSSERVEKLGLTLRPWRTDGNHILVCGQVPWDASVDHIDFNSWLGYTKEILGKITKRPIRFRPHPQISKPDLSLEEDMENCWAVVTFNSNVGVNALLAGIPIFVDDAGAMGLAVANADIANIETPKTPNRVQWLNDLCFSQWTHEEMRQGLAWQHLSH